MEYVEGIPGEGAGLRGRAPGPKPKSVMDNDYTLVYTSEAPGSMEYVTDHVSL